MMDVNVLSTIESRRRDLISVLDSDRKSANGQFMTPLPVARAMADMFDTPSVDHIRLLDPGAGTGPLTFAFIEMLLDRGATASPVEAVLYEADPFLAGKLRDYSDLAERQFQAAGLDVKIDVVEDDFISVGVEKLIPTFESRQTDFRPFTHVIANPPYRKIHSSSDERALLSGVGISVNNLYSAFVALSIKLLSPTGELVAITPRSFCNGPYFRPFRKLLLNEASFEHIHLFERRDEAFSEDDVLQENVVYYMKKTSSSESVRLSTSNGRHFDAKSDRSVPHSQIVDPSDADRVIRIPANEFDDYVLHRTSTLSFRLHDYGLQVSTGPVVDFRVRDFIHDDLDENCVPLIYPAHFQHQSVDWPSPDGKKPNSIEIHPSTENWLFQNAQFALVKRFSSKEERRRLYPAVYIPIEGFELVGFENHLNVIHSSGNGIDEALCRGLVAYLSSTIADLYFRQFSGHTQVNASDLRSFPLPPTHTLLELAEFFGGVAVQAHHVDRYLEEVFRSQFFIDSPNPVEIVHS